MVTAGRRRKDDNRVGKLWISVILAAFVAVMSVQIVRVHEKDQEYAARQAELELQLESETDRKAELEEYEAYTRSQKYVEDVAKSKLGLAHDDEIIFKEVE